ncbi:MAG TPA: GIY-YIG nuclease family protein [Bacteroidia bacterium]|nr:GIY-YIG nuclease family protein [Bacteroidia bacterium]
MSISYCVYILYSVSLDKYYTGQTDDIGKRLGSHKSGISPYTSKAKDWGLVYTEQFSSRKEALARENEIKKKKSRRYIECLIGQRQGVASVSFHKARPIPKRQNP